MEITALATAARNKAIYMKANAAFNENRLTDASQFFALDYISDNVAQGNGRTSVQTYYENMRALWPDVKVTVVQAVAEGDFVMVMCRATATHSTVVMGIQPTHKKIDIAYWNLHHHDPHGVIIKGWNMLDNAALMQQIGLLPTNK